MLAAHRTSPAQIAVIGPYDVLCGRQKDAFNNLGNRRFRVTIDNHLPEYVNASTRKGKSFIIKTIAELMKQIGGRFLKKKQPSNICGVIYTELSETQAYEKIGHALRDMALANKKNNGRKTTPIMSSLGRRKRALQGTKGGAAPSICSGITPQPTPPPSKKNVHWMRAESERTAVSIIPPMPFCKTQNPFVDGLRMPFSRHPSGTFADPSRQAAVSPSGTFADPSRQAAVPPPIARMTSNSISMSPEELGVLFSCLNSNNSTSSISSASSTSICPSTEEFGVLMANLTRSTTSTSLSCSLSQNNAASAEEPVGGAIVFPAPPVMLSWESLQLGERAAFADGLTHTSSSPFSAVTLRNQVSTFNKTTSHRDLLPDGYQVTRL